jgi:hypothetical protein
MCLMIILIMSGSYLKLCEINNLMLIRDEQLPSPDNVG